MRYKKGFHVQEQVVVKTRNERTKSNAMNTFVVIAKCARESNGLSLMKIIESDGFIERAVYHNGCATNYLLKLKPEENE
jgi:FtsZ-interacting cell division protein ZipA